MSDYRTTFPYQPTLRGRLRSLWRAAALPAERDGRRRLFEFSYRGRAPSASFGPQPIGPPAVAAVRPSPSDTAKADSPPPCTCGFWIPTYRPQPLKGRSRLRRPQRNLRPRHLCGISLLPAMSSIVRPVMRGIGRIDRVAWKAHFALFVSVPVANDAG
jgi:hypothetical protein